MFASLVHDIAGLGDEALSERFDALERARRASEAEMASVVAEVRRRALAKTDGHRSVGGWMRARALLSRGECTRRERLARLCSALPAVGDALVAGTLGVDQADELARAGANPRCGGELGDVLPVLLEHARHLSFDDFRLLVARWETLADADGAHRAEAVVDATRTASVVVSGGVVHVSARGTAAAGAELLAVFERFRKEEFEADAAAARLGGGTMPRTDAQRRFDALLAIFRAAVAAPEGAQPPEPIVNVVVDQVTFERALAARRLIALRPDLPSLRIEQRRCETASGVALTPDAAVRAALAGHVRRVVMDSSGVVIDLGRKRRLFSGAAAEAARMQATHCGFAGCDVVAALCEIDHLIEWARHGPTNPGNGAPLCRTHNQAKLVGFRVERDERGRLRTLRPDGRRVGV